MTHWIGEVIEVGKIFFPVWLLGGENVWGGNASSHNGLGYYCNYWLIN